MGVIRAGLVAIVFIGGSAQAAPPPYAAIIVDANSGRVLFEHKADSVGHPASLAKMMTLYLTFESLRSGELKPGAPLVVSKRAARQPPSRLGLKRGQTVTTESAVLALVTKSANDVATVLAEAIAGDETRFVDRMNAKAWDLGMSDSRFRNPSGLHAPQQVTTARDMMVLARALMRDFPEEYSYFSVREFEHEGRVYTNHNRLLGNYTGTDGIKTGYVRAAGFNLAASVHREGQHLLGVVMGSRNASLRDLNMIYLFEAALTRLRVEGAGGTLSEAAVQRPGAPTSFDLLDPVDAETPETRWGVQVGAFSESTQAQKSGQAAANLVPGLLRQAHVSIVEVRNQGRTLHRARVMGVTRNDAWRACARLQIHDVACMPVEPDGGFVAFN